MAVGEWDRRELCPDGSCTGLIGPEGTCKVCGRAAPNWGDERTRGTQDADGDGIDDEVDDDVAPDPIKPATKVSIGGGEWTARTLCPDGGCVGLIGEDGTCKVCGKTGVAAPPSSEADDDAEYDDDEDDADSDGEDYEDEGDEDAEADDDDDGVDDELAAAADEMAGVASSSEVASAASIASPDADEDTRKLCPDGACIGVIGDDGKCKICRKEAAA